MSGACTTSHGDLGGVAMFGAFLLAMFVAWRLDAFHLVFTSSSELSASCSVPRSSSPSGCSTTSTSGPPREGLGHRARRRRHVAARHHDVLLPHPVLRAVVLSPDLAPLVTVLWVAEWRTRST
jgi:hypothetical protein